MLQSLSMKEYPQQLFQQFGLSIYDECHHISAEVFSRVLFKAVTKFKRLFKIEFPLAFPHMMLGLNQTIVFALFMVIIGAFIGTEDLGQYILKALSDKNGAGIGLTLGICVAFIGLIFDNLIRTWVDKRKKHLGID